MQRTGPRPFRANVVISGTSVRIQSFQLAKAEDIWSVVLIFYWICVGASHRTTDPAKVALIRYQLTYGEAGREIRRIESITYPPLSSLQPQNASVYRPKHYSPSITVSECTCILSYALGLAATVQSQ